MADEKSKTGAEGQKPEPLKVGELEFESPEALVESYQNLKKEHENLQKVHGRQTNELGGLRKKTSQSTQPASYVGSDDEVLDNPSQTLNSLASKVKQEIIEELSMAESAKKKEQGYWDEFFSENKHLESHRQRIVNDAYTRLWPELEELEWEDQAKRIANEWDFLADKDLPDSNSGSEPPSGGSSGLTRPSENSSKDKNASSGEKNTSQLMTDRFNEIYGDD